MAKGLLNDLYVTETRYGNIQTGSEDAWLNLSCPACGGTQAVLVAYKNPSDPDRPPVQWTRCVNCHQGAVVNSGVMAPSRRPLRDVRGLDTDTERAWNEVRGCLSVAASVAATHMCRKILLHVAVEKGLPPKNDKDRAPAFAECLEYLQTKGYVTPPMFAWVDQIRDKGNEAAHELIGPDPAAALLVAEFTLQLLVLTYEMPAAMESRS